MFQSFTTALDCEFSNCGFDGNGANPPVQALTGSSVSASFVNSRYIGATKFLDFTATSSVPYLHVYGGNLGTNAAPIGLAAPASTQGVVLANQAWNTYTPTLTAGSGAITAYVATGFFQRVGKTVYGTVR